MTTFPHLSQAVLSLIFLVWVSWRWIRWRSSVSKISGHRPHLYLYSPLCFSRYIKQNSRLRTVSRVVAHEGGGGHIGQFYPKRQNIGNLLIPLESGKIHFIWCSYLSQSQIRCKSEKAWKFANIFNKSSVVVTFTFFWTIDFKKIYLLIVRATIYEKVFLPK